MKQIRKRLTYANLMSSIAVFLVIGGGAAFAATQLPKNSVGTKQLKKNAVAVAKIRGGAVTRKKVKNNAINSAKIANNSVKGTDINAASTPFSRVVARPRGSATVAVDSKGTVYPLESSSYVQGAGEDNTFIGAVDVTFDPACKAPRSAAAYLQIDSPKPSVLEIAYLLGIGQVEDKGEGTVSRRVEIGPYPGFGASRFGPSTDTTHTLSLLLVGNCASGSGVSASFGGVDVIGTK